MRNSHSILLGAVVLAGLAVPSIAFGDEIAGDPVAGAKVFKKCAACHVATEEKNKVGPHLVGIIGRKVASVEGYRYSKAMVEHAKEVPVWSVEVLTSYLHHPRQDVKGTKMAFAGLKKDKDVENVIAYLNDPAAAKK